MKNKVNATYREKYEEYLRRTEHLDDSARMTELKRAIWRHIFRPNRRSGVAVRKE